MDESLKPDVMYWAAFYERRMRVGNKKIFHLEAWVVKVMSLYKVMCSLWGLTSPWGVWGGHLYQFALALD